MGHPLALGPVRLGPEMSIMMANIIDPAIVGLYVVICGVVVGIGSGGANPILETVSSQNLKTLY